jgi:segregation and condensation protein B
MTDSGERADAKDEVAVERTAQDISGAVEALLLLADEPLSENALAEAVGVPRSVIDECLAELVAFYDETGRGFELRQIGGGWRYYTREEHADLVARYVLEPQQSRLSQAALETLAVVAYSQPISRARISAIRGVNVDGVIRTLLARGLITEAGHDPESGAVVFATTSYFLERMGLRSLDELPELAPHLPEVSELEAELRQLAMAGDTGSEPLSTRPEPVSTRPEPVEGQEQRASTSPASDEGDD